MDSKVARKMKKKPDIVKRSYKSNEGKKGKLRSLAMLSLVGCEGRLSGKLKFEQT